MTATRIDRGSTDTTTIYSEDRELVFERTFDAPRALVWKAFTDPDLVPRWWGKHGTTTTVVEMDVRPGGKWRYINSAPDRDDVAFYGEYLEVVPTDLQVDLHVRRRGCRPDGRPRVPFVLGCRRQDEDQERRVLRLGRNPSTARSRPAWSKVRSRPGIASRPCWPGDDPPRRKPGTRSQGVRLLCAYGFAIDIFWPTFEKVRSRS